MTTHYLLFAGDDTPKGGGEDLQGAYNTLSAARRAAAVYGWWNVLDGETLQMVESKNKSN